MTVVALVGIETAYASGPLIDGLNIPTDFAGHLQATQGIGTGWGDDTHPDQVYGGGSELDQLFVDPDIGDGFLRLGITGNLEPAYPSGPQNGFMIFLDTRSGGENVLDANNGWQPVNGDGQDFLEGLEGVQFDAGFEPDHCIIVNAGDGQQPETFFVDIVDLDSEVYEWIGEQDFGAHTGTLRAGTSPNGWQVAFDNSNTLGVGSSPAGEPDLNAATATTGLEFVIPVGDIDAELGATLGIQVLLSNRHSTPAYISNQSLPTLPDYTPNLENSVPDFSQIAGDQHVVVSLVPEPVTAMTLLIALVPMGHRRRAG